MARLRDLGQIRSKRKAIIALLPYSVWWERVGDLRMTDAFLGIVRVPNQEKFLAEPIAMLLGEAGPDFPNRVITLMSPHADWGWRSPNANTVTRWAEAALAVQYTEEVGRSVVDTLLQIASNNSLQPYIPATVWAWLKKQPSPPPICTGRNIGSWVDVVRRVRGLGDVEIFESYFLLVWSEWDVIYQEGFTEMCTAIREDLGGIGMGRHREVLIKRLDRVLGQLDMGLGYLHEQNPLLHSDHIPRAEKQYRELRKVLLRVNEKALEVLTRTPFGSIDSFNLLTPVDVHRIPLDIHLCTSSPMPVVAHPRHLILVPNSELRTSFTREFPSVTPALEASSPIDSTLTSRRVSGKWCHASSFSSLYYPVYHNNLPLYTSVPEYTCLITSPFAALLTVLAERRSDVTGSWRSRCSFPPKKR